MPHAAVRATRALRSVILVTGLAVAAGAALTLGSSGRADSSLRLAVPESFGAVDAATYDESGERVGGATVHVVRDGDGVVRLLAESGIEGAEQTRAEAELAAVPGSDELELLMQQTQSFDAEGRSLGRLSVDHRERLATCAPPAGSDGEAETLKLPKGDRVANVPLNLLFLPLVRREAKELDFQLFSCGFGPRLVDVRAVVAQRTRNGGGSELVEIRYELDIPSYLSWAARPFMPNVSVWFDSDTQGSWVGHRMPLFAKGPTVLVVRRGFTPSALESPQNGAAGR